MKHCSQGKATHVTHQGGNELSDHWFVELIKLVCHGTQGVLKACILTWQYAPPVDWGKFTVQNSTTLS